ncbi:phosphoribosylanthranilate isomerase [Candidatus Endomicrobiellum trichonymphae]|nr:N-(5'-phosphoribosyl)anthranilate isomerase [Candidatus Endomicrobium trichonymphae]
MRQIWELIFCGFHFIKDSSRKVSEKLVSDIVSKLHPFVAPIAVFSGQDEKAVSKIIKKCSIKNIRFNGNEVPEFCKFVRDRQSVKIFKFFKLDNETDILKLTAYTESVDYFVLDVSYSDVEIAKFNHTLISKAGELKIPFFVSLSASADAKNIESFLKEVTPYGFNADSSIERSPKRKDYDIIMI